MSSQQCGFAGCMTLFEKHWQGGSMEKKRVGLWIGKALFYAVLFTAVVLLLLALFMYKADLSQEAAGHLLLLVYVGAPFLGGCYLGTKTREKRYLWGLLFGGCYFLLFLAGSLLIGGVENMDVGALFRVFLMVLAGGVLGGMLS